MKLAASEWLDDMDSPGCCRPRRSNCWMNGWTSRKPYPLSWEEQERLFAELPLHLRQMALFAVNTGCRDQEICQLRWEWEVRDS